MTSTRLPQPTAATVLPCLDTVEWRSTRDVFDRWLGPEGVGMLNTGGRQKLRAEVYYVLDRLQLAGRVERRQVSKDHAEWRRLRFAEDRHTSTVDGAAAFERQRAGHAGPW